MTTRTPAKSVYAIAYSVTHSFDIDALDIHVQLPANATVAIAIKPTQAGPLEFYCAIGGHKAAGMDGTIDVS
jgi:uncharacterized cupredoxin-like copper-binding protein